MSEKYEISDICPQNLANNPVIENWKNFLDDCHVDYKINYIVANDELKGRKTYQSNMQSVFECPEIDFIMPQIDTAVRIKRICDDQLKKVKFIK